MNCELAQERIAERWITGLAEDTRMELDAHLRGCLACRQESESLSLLWNGLGELPEEQPGRELRINFQQMLEAYRLGAASQIAQPTPVGGAKPKPSWLNLSAIRATGWFTPLQPVAQFAMACLVLVAGLVAGHLYTSRGHEQEKQQERQAAMSAEIQNLRQLVALSLLQQPSASERLRGVSYSQTMEPGGAPAGNEVTAALLDRLNHDPNVNVRMAAVDALKQFGSRADVRLGLRQSVPNQDSPLVQISLIDWAAEAKDRGAFASFERMQQQSGLNPAVATRLANAMGHLQ